MYSEGKSSKRKSKEKFSKALDDADDTEDIQSIRLTKQPSMLQNGQLQPHQLDSLNWMITLYDLKLNGILADDMVSPSRHIDDFLGSW